MRNKIFISYSHDDKKWLDIIRKGLKPLERKFEFWDDTQIQTGVNWKSEIDKALASTKVAVLLVSFEYLASDFINKQELPYFLDAAKKNAVNIVWVLLNACLWEETPLESLQAANDDLDKPLADLNDSELKKAIVNICRKIKITAERP